MGIQDDAKRPIINWSILETGVNLVVRQPYSRTIAMILSGAPLPAPIFIGSATTVAPAVGSFSRFATFSNAGTLCSNRVTWLWNCCD